MNRIEAGDRVEDLDSGLAQLRLLMTRVGADPEPNHIGTVDYVDDNGTAYINYDDGTYAPQDVRKLRRLEP